MIHIVYLIICLSAVTTCNINFHNLERLCDYIVSTYATLKSKNIVFIHS